MLFIIAEIFWIIWLFGFAILVIRCYHVKHNIRCAKFSTAANQNELELPRLKASELELPRLKDSYSKPVSVSDESFNLRLTNI